MKKKSAKSAKVVAPKKSATTKQWFGRCALALIVPLLFLMALEVGLHALGFGYDTHFFIRKTLAGKDYWITNPKFGYRFFPPALARTPLELRMEAIKPKNQIRIFLFGESAAEGDPDPSFGVGRYLEVLLRERFPGTDFKVICTAMTAINSHVILPIAREVAHRDGDLWIIYMGNNEMVGPFGASTTFGSRSPNRWLVKTSVALKATRIGQALQAIVSSNHKTGGIPEAWSGLNMFKDNQLRADDPLRIGAYENFYGNLEDILDLAHSHHIPVVLSTVASNLKDCAPFASLHSKKLSPANLSDWEGYYSNGTNAASQGDPQNALIYFKKAAALDDTYADLRFRLGACSLTNGDLKSARSEFEAARDNDALGFRADDAINSSISFAAERHENVQLIDAQSLLNEASGGITGQELFYEHVHLDPQGNYLLARAFADAAAKQLMPKLGQPTQTEWASQQFCDDQLGLSPWDNLRLWQMNYSRVSEPPFTSQLNDAARARSYMATMARYQKQLTEDAKSNALVMYSNAVAKSPDDFQLRQNHSQFLEGLGDIKQAALEEKKASEILPWYPEATQRLGQLLVRDDRIPEAQQCFSKALELDQKSPQAWNELGVIFANKNDSTNAQKCFQIAARLNPGFIETYFNRGFFLEQENHLTEAMADYRIAAQLQPNGPADYFYHAMQAAVARNRAEAIHFLQNTVYMHPTFWQARYLLGVELATSEQVAEARPQFLEVVNRRPDFAKAHLNLGISYAKDGLMQEAMTEFQKTLNLNPTNQAAQDYLAKTSAFLNRQNALPK